MLGFMKSLWKLLRALKPKDHTELHKSSRDDCQEALLIKCQLINTKMRLMEKFTVITSVFSLTNKTVVPKR